MMSIQTGSLGSDVEAVPPSLALGDAFARLLEDYAAHDPVNGEYYAAARTDFGDYVAGLLDEERGINLVDGHVPCSHRWLIDAGRQIVGIARLRHDINTPFLAEEAGHVGYDVPPSHRGRGHSRSCLRAALSRARELNIPRVLVFADAGNPASWRTIERCGGVLEREFVSPHYGCLVRRYWIEVAEG